MTRNTSFTRGETIEALLVIPSGTLTDATCRMALKASRNGTPPGDAAPVAAEFDVVLLDNIDPDDLTSPPAFYGTIPASESEGLANGWYAMDARIVNGGSVVYTDAVRIKIEERVTPNA